MLTLLNTRRRHPGRLFHKMEPQIFDLLQLTRAEKEYKAAFLSLKERLHRGQDGMEEKNRNIPIIFLRSEGTLLRKKVQAAALMYRLARRERMRVFREYMDRLPTKNSFLRKAA